MYNFFTIFGFLFVTTAAVLINYIYNIFSINKLTSFLYPIDGRTVWNEVNITVLPTIVWGFIELPVLGNNHNFLISILLNILVSCAIIYIIKYGFSIIFNKEGNLINIISIYIASFFGQVVSFMILKTNTMINVNISSFIISIVGMILILIIYSLLIIIKPKVKDLKEIFDEKR